MPQPVTVPEQPSLQDAVQFTSHVKDPNAINWTHGLPAVFLGGVIAAAFMIFPLGIFGLGMIAAGALSTFFYNQRNPTSNLSAFIGIKLGALSGVIGFAIFTIFTTVVTLVSGSERLHAMLLDAINQSAARTNDPEVLRSFEYFKTSAGLAIVLVIGLVFLLLMFLVFSTAGGALGARWIRRRRGY